jgi:hypothetical protein
MVPMPSPNRALGFEPPVQLLTNVAFLKRYPEFVEFQSAKKPVTDSEVMEPEASTATPEEALALGT